MHRCPKGMAVGGPCDQTAVQCRNTPNMVAEQCRSSQLMWKSVLVKVMTNRLCTDRGKERCPDMIITCAQVQVAGKVVERSSHKARLTELTMSDETLEERVIAVGKKRNFASCVLPQKCAGLNADTLENFLLT